MNHHIHQRPVTSPLRAELGADMSVKRCDLCPVAVVELVAKRGTELVAA